ncbi:sodium/hydrogen exchanger 3 isoform X2 [Eurytemora carolleeae]|uniref:sodium/hydrogen exchanger 3 isoform X2 n=1 Tax=Eurytemora carolleeae TaxID=1294199 RepID=UPI000C75FD7F|nr:sodium/hydrogen exchanger 3 isoform X2 [Eurytemora carolleeae]|eukprot:XP_023342387.1 sodium/hydrogen exchanger 3-like isoform X2 [Eurytemora affinis]
MAYGGLRGAVGFSLVLLIDNNIVPCSGIFVTATLAMVMQTCFFQGSTIKPFVGLLKIDLAKAGDVTLSEEINEKIFEHIMAGVEIISGKMGHYVLADKLYHFDQTYMKKWICVPNYEKRMKKSYEKKILSDHLINLYGPAVLVKQNMENIDTIKENGFENLAYIPENEVLTDISM